MVLTGCFSTAKRGEGLGCSVVCWAIVPLLVEAAVGYPAWRTAGGVAGASTGYPHGQFCGWTLVCCGGSAPSGGQAASWGSLSSTAVSCFMPRCVLHHAGKNTTRGAPAVWQRAETTFCFCFSLSVAGIK